MGENKMEDEMKSEKGLIRNQMRPENGKRSYHKPELAIFGDVQELTANSLPFRFLDFFVLDLTTG